METTGVLTEKELRDYGRRFIFQGGSPFATDLADQLARLRRENERLRDALEEIEMLDNDASKIARAALSGKGE